MSPHGGLPSTRALARALAGAVGVALMAGCGEVTVEVLLDTELTAEELQRVVRYSAAVTVDGRELARAQVLSEGARLELPAVDWTRRPEVYIAALGSSDLLQAYAESHPELPDEAQHCCFVACLCTRETHRAGGCTCGRDACTTDCTLD